MAHPLIEYAERALADLHFAVQRVDGDTTQLLVRLPDDARGRERHILVTVYENLGANLENAYLLQFFAGLPGTVLPAARNELARIAVAINTRLPLGAFGFLSSDGTTFYRSVAMLPEEQSGWTKIISEYVFIAIFELDEFGPAIEAVASGQQTAVAAAAADPRLEPLA